MSNLDEIGLTPLHLVIIIKYVLYIDLTPQKTAPDGLADSSQYEHDMTIRPT
jgi:hypothetical protein